MVAGDSLLDYFYLFDALALFILAGLLPTLNRRTNRLLPWNWLGLFALCRGIYQILSLPSLIQLMPPSLETLRYILLFLSLAFLFEFGRASNNTEKGPVPWWLLYTILAIVIIFGIFTGLKDMSILVFGLSLISGLWAAWGIFNSRDRLAKGRHTMAAAAVMMIFYALVSSFSDNSEFFASNMGMPLPLVRALIVLGFAFCLFRLSQVSLDRIMASRTQKLYWHLAYGTIIGLIFISAVGLVGSFGVNYLGSKAAAAALAKNQRTALHLQGIINGEMEKADRLVQLLAASARVMIALVNNQDPEAVNQASRLLDRMSQLEEGFGVCYLMNLHGVTIATSNRNQPDSFLGKNFGFRPYFRLAALGLQGRDIALGTVSRELGYYSSAPVRDDKGVIVGVAVIKRVIRTSGEIREAFDPNSLTFLVDPHGIIVFSNQSANVLRSLWPIKEADVKEILASKQFGPGPFTALLDRQPVAGKDYQLAGQRLLAQVQPTLMEGWNLYHFGSIQAVPFYRLMGSGVILVFCLAMIGFYVSWDANSYKAARAAGAEPAPGEFLSKQQVDEDLSQSELKYQTLAKHVGEMSEMGDLLQGCNSFSEMISVITRYMERLFPEFSGGIYLAGNLPDQFEIGGVWGEAAPKERFFTKEDCWALQRGRSHLVDDPSNSLVCHHLPEAFPPGYQCWPLVAQGEILGVLHLRKARGRNNRVTNTDAEPQKEIRGQLVAIVVEQISLILANLNLRKASQTQIS